MKKLLPFLFLLSLSSFAQLKAYWSGVAGIYITDGKNGVYFDPVFHRPGPLDILFNRPLKIDEKVVASYLKKMGDGPIDAIFVSHSHHDHASDVGAVAKLKGSVVHGTKTTRYITKAFGVTDEKIKEIRHGDKYKYGDFEIEVIQSKHGKILGYFEFQFGELDHPVKRPIKLRDFRMGDAYTYLITYKGKKYLFQQASRFTPELKKRIKGEKFEVVFQGLGNRRSTADLRKNIWELANIKTIVPIHHDNFFAPLKKNLELELLININFDEFKSEMSKSKYQTIYPKYFQSFSI